MMAETKRERRSIHRALHRVLGGNLQLRLVLAALFVGAASTWLFAELGEEIWFHEALVAIELRVLTWIEALRTLDGNAFFRLVTRFGDPLTVMAVVAVALAILALYRRYVEAAILAAGIVGSGAMVEAAKWLIHRERPPAAMRLVEATGMAFPSGHSAIGMVGYVFIAYLIAGRFQSPWRRAAVIGFGLAAALLIGFSRLYLGVHWPSDVIGGFAVAGMWLSAMVLAAEVIRLRYS